MGYGQRAGFGASLWQAVQTAAAKTAVKPVTLVPLTSPVAPPPGTMTTQGPESIRPILVAGPAPSPSGGGGGGGGGDFGLAPAPSGGAGVASLLQQPAVLIGLAILGFLALRRGGGTRRF